jgi:hypothetical protein
MRLPEPCIHSGPMSPIGPSRHFAPRTKRRFGSEADIGLGGSQASEERARIYFGSSFGPTYGVEKLATPDFKLLDLKGKPPSRFTGPRVNHRAPSPS